MRRTPLPRTYFLVKNGWEPVRERTTGNGQPIMWRDPLYADRPDDGLHGRVLSSEEAEYLTEERLATVRSVMED